MEDAARALQRLRDFNINVDEGDAGLAQETADHGGHRELSEMALGPHDLDQAIVEESIILRRHRPVLRVMQDTTELEFDAREDSEIWKARLIAAKEQIDAAIKAVGRINLEGTTFDWVGTGWLVRKEVIVTNRHVAQEFVGASSTALRFTMGFSGDPITAGIDFLKEFERAETREFRLLKPIYVAPKGGPDIAFFEVEQVNGGNRLSDPIALATRPRETNNVAAIGYPAFDTRIPDIELMERIYGRQYNKKRLAPGAVTDLDEVRVWHNCATLGGNSGSAVIDLDSGEALGLHFSGAFLQTNYAVRADVVSRTLEDVLSGMLPSHRPAAKRPTETMAQGRGGLQATSVGGAISRGTATITVPLTLTVSLGTPVVGGPALGSKTLTATASSGQAVAVSNSLSGDDDEIDVDVEARPEDYEDREGYQPLFIADREEFVCPLPVVTRASADVLDFEFMGGRQTELKYENFSVVMSRNRRLCFFSAVNIDGSKTERASRVRWRWDPRISREEQVMKECYGNPPKFGRGHMTRRNDPSWGPMAERGNRDSMHVTNASPQMQAFNSPIWLELEDYALENAIDDGMKIAVFTGPFFRSDDPVYHGVKVPVSYWKIIAFKHDHTGRLCATGYRMNQKQSLPPRMEEEFVFGTFVSSHTGVLSQVSIHEIELEAGIDFGPLAALDPLAAEEESLGRGNAERPILTPSQIRYF